MIELTPNQIYKVEVNGVEQYYAYAGTTQINEQYVYQFYDYQNMTGMYHVPTIVTPQPADWQSLILDVHPTTELTKVELNVLGGLIFTLLGKDGEDYHNLPKIWDYAMENDDVEIFNDLLLKFELIRQSEFLRDKYPNALRILLYKASNIIEAMLQIYF